jgi:hypothetical protein
MADSIAMAREGGLPDIIQKVRVYADGLPSDALLCSVCLETFVDASSLPCGHTFCEFCLKSSLDLARRCPLCRTKVAVVTYPSPNIELRDIVGQLRVRCSGGIAMCDGEWFVDTDGCPEVVTVESKEEHERLCPFAFHMCPYTECGQVIRLRDFGKHMDENAREHALAELNKRRLNESIAAEVVATPDVTPPDFNQSLLFELYGASPYDSEPPAVAWHDYSSSHGPNSFCAAWADQCTSAGLLVVPLLRAEGGVCTPDEEKQLRFLPPGQAITGSKEDIQTRSRGAQSGTMAVWSIPELVVLKESFVKAMERRMGSLDDAGERIVGSACVRGRLFLEFRG